MQIVKPPEIVYSAYQLTVFAAGSIENGKAENWQPKLEAALEDVPGLLFNPRRDDWDSTWEQSITNPKFSGQVNWELDHIELSRYVFFYFSPGTSSPITLMELGIVSKCKDKVVVVVCPKGYWRKGNVDVLCSRANIPVFLDIDEGILEFKSKIVKDLS